MRWLSLIIACACVAASGKLAAYELATHARITLEAFNQSSLQTDSERLRDLGIPSLKNTLLGDKYYDVRGNVSEIRNSYDFDFDLGKMPGVVGLNADRRIPRRANGWLMRGAIREDDSGYAVGVYAAIINRSESEPADDPYLNFNRWCNHFFDPLTYRRLTDANAIPLCLLETYASAPVWASGAADPFASPQQEQMDRRNHFTLYDTREAMWRAITGYDRSQRPVATTGLDRKAYWATTFRSLGDILHLNQDMAQPQHTRNESHGTSHSSVYEKYIDARAKGDKFFRVDGRLVFPATMPVLVYAGYAPPRFSHYSKYWSTARGQASMDSGKGLADYSSRGFFTPAGNIDDTGYPLPSHDFSKYSSLAIVTAGGSKEEYLVASVPDKYLDQASDPIRMTRRSVWDDGLIAIDGNLAGATFSLDQATYDDRAALLLPRAVGYSAGLLDYFFNGRLTIGLPAAGAYAVADHSTGEGFTKVRLKLTNTTPPLIEDGTQYPQNMLNGTAVAVVKFHYNKCYQPNLSGEYGAPNVALETCRDRVPSQVNPPLDFDDSAESIVVSAFKPLSLNAGVTVPLEFDFSSSPIPLNATDIYLQVAYRGPLGPDAQSAEQDVVVVGTRDISEPTYFSYFNASDYIHIGANVFTRQDVAASQALLGQVRPTACVTGTSPNLQLRNDCFIPMDLTMKFSFADLNDPTVAVINLPSRRYLRFAFLTEVATTVDKAVLQQQGNCLPLDTIDIVPIRNQLQFESDPPAFVDSSRSLWKLRGIYGNTQIACVINGDGSAPTTDDDRNVKLSALVSNSAESQPFPLVVNPAFLGP